MPVATLSALLMLVSGEPAERAAAKPEPGWRCALERRGPFGMISSSFEISKRPEAMPPYLRWDAGDGSFRNPWITAAFYRKPDGTYDLTNGYVGIMRHIWSTRRGKKPAARRLRLEVRTTLAEARYGAAVISSAARRSGGPFHIQLAWNDLAALARGAEHLYLIARDRKSRMIDHVELDRTVFDRAAPHITAAMREVERIYADPASHCTYTDDLRDSDIVVTGGATPRSVSPASPPPAP